MNSSECFFYKTECSICYERIYVKSDQKGETVFHRDIQTPRRELKYDAQRSIKLDELRGDWIVDDTLSLLSRNKNLVVNGEAKLSKSLMIKGVLT